MKKYEVVSFDTDGVHSSYGVFDTKEEAIKKFEEVHATTIVPLIDDMFEEVEKKSDSFTGSIDHYKYWLKVSEKA